jgi:YegS/Rv2252/BmrU family lipid kinase
MTRVAVVANTKKLAKADAGRLKDALRRSGLDRTKWITIEKGSAATKATAKALDRGADVVLVCGGDGTVRAASQALVGADAALAVLPTGTANLFASAMNFPDDPAELVELIRGGERRTIDTGTCNGLTFNIMAGTGFDAAMIDSADDDKERLGMVSYLRAGVKQAREREAFEMRVEVDDKNVFEGSASCVLVGNIGTLKGGVEAFPDASPTDGVLDVAVVTATGLRAWTGLMVSAVRGRQHLTRHAKMWSGRSVSVLTDSKHRFELDGGVKGTAKKFDFQVVPGSLVVCAPHPPR